MFTLFEWTTRFSLEVPPEPTIRCPTQLRRSRTMEVTSFPSFQIDMKQKSRFGRYSSKMKSVFSPSAQWQLIQCSTLGQLLARQLRLPPAPCLALTQQGNSTLLTSCPFRRLRGERTIGCLLSPFLTIWTTPRTCLDRVSQPHDLAGTSQREPGLYHLTIGLLPSRAEERPSPPCLS